jgi:hypothetical protein
MAAGLIQSLLRSDESAEQKWQYMRENPVRAGLVHEWSDWPYRIGFEWPNNRCRAARSAGPACSEQATRLPYNLVGPLSACYFSTAW